MQRSNNIPGKEEAARQPARLESARRPIPAPHAPAASWLALQQTHGNRFVQRLLRSGLPQTRLTVSEPGDRYEQEADRVADRVMSMGEPEVSRSAAEPGVNVSRVCAQCDERIGRQTSEEDEDTNVQTKEAGDHTPELSADAHRQIIALRGGGSPLPDSARAFFEPRFDCDFSDVRVHTDGRAAELARGMNALAFTIERDVAFAAGQYAPDSVEGRKLLAHELTHVVQQSGPVRRKPGPSGANDCCKRAEQIDGTVVSRESQTTREVGRLKAPPSIQRRLVTFGALADVNALLGLIGPRAGLTLNMNAVNNQVQAVVLPGVPPSAALRTQLTTIINHATRHAEVVIARGQPLVQVGAFPQPADLTVTRVQRIDIDDILAIEAGAPGNGVAKAAHEIQENFRAHFVTPIAGVDRFDRAHERALEAESDVAAQLVGPGRRDGGVTVNTGAGTTTVVQDFENYYLVFTTTFAAATQNRVITTARRAAPVVINAPRTIDNFGPGAGTVPAAGAAAIAAAAADVAANPTATVLIEGFSDSGGSAAGNLATSRRRARRTRAALVTAGVAEGRIRLEPRGAVNFVAPNNNAANRALNRRVVITVRRPGP